MTNPPYENLARGPLLWGAILVCREKCPGPSSTQTRGHQPQGHFCTNGHEIRADLHHHLLWVRWNSGVNANISISNLLLIVCDPTLVKTKFSLLELGILLFCFSSLPSLFFTHIKIKGVALAWAVDWHCVELLFPENQIPACHLQHSIIPGLSTTTPEELFCFSF